VDADVDARRPGHCTVTPLDFHFDSISTETQHIFQVNAEREFST
jgi:hypothetical protein